MNEFAYAVRPLSKRDIARAAEQFLRKVAPEHLCSGEPLDLAELVDRRLDRVGIWVCPVSREELWASEAETRSAADGTIEILMREEFYDALFDSNSNTVRARSTLAHEIGHAVLHPGEVRTGRLRPHVLALKRERRDRLKPYEDSEWQAHVFAGALLIPRQALQSADLDDTVGLSLRFGVSIAFTESHLRRFRRLL